MTSLNYRPFVKALYPVGALLVLVAVSEPILQVWPFRPGEVRWRFGAVGLMSGAVVGGIFGLVWIMAVAALLDHRRTLRAAAVVSMVVASILTLVLLAFGLDFLQVRSSVNPDFRPTLDLTVLRAVMVLGLSIPTTIALGVGGWRASRPSGAARSGRAERGAGVVFTPQPH
jgi:hypothetical protein